MMTEGYSKSKKKVENQKLIMMKTKNMSGIGCVIALITAAAMGSAFLISRKHKTNNITKKERMEEESSNKGLQFILPGSSSSSPCIQQLQPSSVGTDKLCLNDNDSTSLFSTPCSIQDDKPKLGMSDEKRDTLNAIVSDHPKEVGKSPSFDRLPIYEEELVLSETKISLPLDADQELNEVSRARVEVIQENEKTEVLEHVNQAQDTISYNPALQLDNKREILVHNDKGESNELHHTGVIEMDNLEEGLIQEQEKQAAGYQEAINPDGSLQETSTLTEHEPLNTAFDLMKAADEDEDKDHMQSMHFEEQCADAKTQIDQFSKKCDIQMQFNDEEECAKENDQTNSRYEEATSENCPCRTYSIVVPASGIINVSIDDKHPAEAYEDEDKGHMQIMYFEEHCADAETKIDRISKKCNKKKQFSDKQVCSNENDQENSCYEEAMSENSHCRTYSVDMQILAASEIRNASVDDQNSSEVTQVIKETNVMDPAASGEQSAETDCSPIQLVEKQSFEQDCQENVLEEDNEASKSLSMDIEVVIKDLEAHSKEEKDEVEESVFVYGEEDDDYDNDIEKDAAAPETLDNISEVARNFSEQSNSDKVCAADSNKDLLLELKKEKKVNEEEEGMKIEENETCSVENCSLKSTQNDFTRTSYKQSSNGKDDPTVNVIDSYRRKLISLDDIAAIPWGRKLLLGVLLVLIWYFVLKGILPSGIGIFRF